MRILLFCFLSLLSCLSYDNNSWIVIILFEPQTISWFFHGMVFLKVFGCVSWLPGLALLDMAGAKTDRKSNLDLRSS